MTIEEIIGDKLKQEIMNNVEDDNIVTIDVEAETVEEKKDKPEEVIEVVPEKGKDKDYRKLFEKIRALRRRINPDGFDSKIELEEIGEGVKALGNVLKTIFQV